jgi:hypothetical protein
VVVGEIILLVIVNVEQTQKKENVVVGEMRKKVL